MDTSAPADYQPRLRWYSHLWRDVVCVLVGALVWSAVAERQFDEGRLDLIALEIVAGIVAAVLAHFRRRWPMAIAVATALLTPITSIGAGFILLATVSLATYRVRWQVVTLGLLNLAMTACYNVIQPTTATDPMWLVVTFTVAFTAAALAWGMFIGSRRELLWTLRQRAEEAEAERDLRASQARSNERSRIAREMHDVLAHRISQISMHAGALSFRDDLTTDQMRDSVAVIQQKAHEALTDLRDVLGVLREDDSVLNRPQPTYDDLGVLIADARAAGDPIEYDDTLGARPPEAIGRTLYRIVQEGITNARKHARGARLQIEIGGGPDDEVTVTMRNPLGFGPSATPGAGLGLVGLAERAALRGGRLEHRVEGRTFVLRAWLPWSP